MWLWQQKANKEKPKNAVNHLCRGFICNKESQFLKHALVHLVIVTTNNGSYRMWSFLCHVYQVLKTAVKVPLPSLRALFPRWWQAPPLELPHSPHFHTSKPQQVVLVQRLKKRQTRLSAKCAHLESQSEGLQWIWWPMNSRQSNKVMSDVYLSISMLWKNALSQYK